MIITLRCLKRVSCNPLPGYLICTVVWIRKLAPPLHPSLVCWGCSSWTLLRHCWDRLLKFVTYETLVAWVSVLRKLLRNNVITSQPSVCVIQGFYWKFWGTPISRMIRSVGHKSCLDSPIAFRPVRQLNSINFLYFQDPIDNFEGATQRWYTLVVWRRIHSSCEEN